MKARAFNPILGVIFIVLLLSAPVWFPPLYIYLCYLVVMDYRLQAPCDTYDKVKGKCLEYRKNEYTLKVPQKEFERPLSFYKSVECRFVSIVGDFFWEEVVSEPLPCKKFEDRIEVAIDASRVYKLSREVEEEIKRRWNRSDSCPLLELLPFLFCPVEGTIKVELEGSRHGYTLREVVEKDILITPVIDEKTKKL